MPKGFRRQAPYSSRLDYGLLLIYLTGKFSYLSINISLAWGVEETILKKKITKKNMYIDVVIEYRYLFLSLLTLWYPLWLAFRPENYIQVSNLVLDARVVEKK